MYQEDVTKITQGVVLEGPKPAKIVAEIIGKPYSTLLREINPYDTGAKIGVETLLQIMKVTQNSSPLDFMAKELGYTLVPLDRLVSTKNFAFHSKFYPATQEVEASMEAVRK